MCSESRFTARWRVAPGADTLDADFGIDRKQMSLDVAGMTPAPDEEPTQAMSRPCHVARSPADAVVALRAFLDSHRRIFVLTGAGCSTDAGIPDYRDRDGRWKRPQPVTWQSFIEFAATRRRYWARSLVGWPAVGRARPTLTHRALAALERAGKLSGLVTQNVDRLHQHAGHVDVVDLHGRLDRVICLSCRHDMARSDWQQQLLAANPNWSVHSAAFAPDGDADLADADYEAFTVPACPRCGGIVKPDVVFFGENVPRDRVARSQRWLDEADAMLVVGSSLMVYSGFRFAQAAARRDMPLAALNLGHTRADDLLTLKLDAPCADTLSFLAAADPDTRGAADAG